MKKVTFRLKFDPNDVDQNESVEYLLFDMETETSFTIDVSLSDDSDSDLLTNIIEAAKDDVKSWLSEYLEEADKFMVESNFDDNELPGKDYAMQYINVLIEIAGNSKSFTQPVSYFFD